LVRSILLEKPSGLANNFPQKGRGLGHVTGKNVWQTIPNILKIIWAADFKFGQQLIRIWNADWMHK